MRYLFILLVAFIFGCSSFSDRKYILDGTAKERLSVSQSELWNKIIGQWNGEQVDTDGNIKKEFISMFADGTYKIEFRTIKRDGTEDVNVEVGRWGVSGNILFETYEGWLDSRGNFHPTNKFDSSRYDAYIILNINESMIEYQHIETRNIFINHRVASVGAGSTI